MRQGKALELNDAILQFEPVRPITLMGRKLRSKWIDWFQLSSIQKYAQRWFVFRHETMKNESDVALCFGYHSIDMLSPFARIMINSTRQAIKRTPEYERSLISQLFGPRYQGNLVMKLDLPAICASDLVKIPSCRRYITIFLG